MPEKEYASKGVAGAGLGLGIAGTALGLLNEPGILGNLFGGRRRDHDHDDHEHHLLHEIDREREKNINLLNENTLLKSKSYTDEQTRGLQAEISGIRIDQARQGEQIVGINTQAGLREQITEGKIAQVAQAATSGVSQLQIQLNNLQGVVDRISSPYVPAAKVTPLPAPNPFPPVPPYAPFFPYPYPFPFPPFGPFPPVPPNSTSSSSGSTNSGTTTTSSSSGD